MGTAVAYGNGAARSERHQVNGEEMYAKAVHAWNAWRAGRAEVAPLKWYPDAKRPPIR